MESLATGGINEDDEEDDGDSDILPGDNVSESSNGKVSKSKEQLDQKALRNYEFFYQLPKGSASLDEISNSPAGVNGWANWKPSDS